MAKINLRRFIDAQTEPMINLVFDELRSGRKKTHWMWFIFPQIYGLGGSPNSKLYGIRSLDEAKQYWAHPILGDRLRLSIKLTLDCKETALDLFGKEIDVIKFQSCLTLFAHISPQEPLLKTALQQFFGGHIDSKTMEIIEGMP